MIKEDQNVCYVEKYGNYVSLFVNVFEASSLQG